MTPEKRVVIALKVLDALRAAIEANGGMYSGALVPNIQSVAESLALPDDLLERHLASDPGGAHFVPTADEERELRALWAAA